MFKSQHLELITYRRMISLEDRKGQAKSWNSQRVFFPPEDLLNPGVIDNIFQSSKSMVVFSFLNLKKLP